MKAFAASLGMVVLLAIGLGIAAPTTAPTTGPTTAPATQPGVPINKFCAVEQEHPVNPKHTLVYEGKVIGFCCRDCIPAFKENPQKYMANLK